MAFKILGTADIHISGGADTDEAKALQQIADLAIQEHVNLVTVCGDVFDAKSTPEQRLVFKSFLDKLKTARINTIVIRGNHDEPNDLSIFHDPNNNIWVSELPEEFDIISNGEQLRVLTIPHFNASMLALQSETTGEFGEKGTNCFDDILDDYFQKVARNTGSTVTLFHGTVSGAQLDNGMIPRMNGIHLNVDKLATLNCLVLGGHYHLKQLLAQQVRYLGNPTRTTYSELDDKGVWIFTNTGRNQWDEEFFSLNPTPMHVVEGSFSHELGWLVNGGNELPASISVVQPEDCDPIVYQGAKVKFRYRINQKDLAVVDMAPIEKLFSLALKLDIDRIVEVTTAVRSEAIRHAMSVDDCLRAWGEGKQHSPKIMADAIRLMNDLLKAEKALVTAPETQAVTEATEAVCA